MAASLKAFATEAGVLVANLPRGSSVVSVARVLALERGFTDAETSSEASLDLRTAADNYSVEMNASDSSLTLTDLFFQSATEPYECAPWS